MKKHLKYIDGNSDKFWQIEATGLQYTVTYGKNGTSGTTQTKTFATDAECLKSAEKLLAEKIKKGYSETGEVTAAVKPKTAKSTTADELLKEYDEIIQFSNIDLLLPFLKEKSKGNVGVLKKHIQKCRRYWITETDPNKEQDRYPWGRRANEIQKDIIILSAIALFDKTEINSWNEALFLLKEVDKKPQVLDILLWAKPNWLDTFALDKIKTSDLDGLNYDMLRKLEGQDLLQFNPELYALTLDQNIRDEWFAKMKIRKFITILLNDKIAFQRDIPELFNYETTLHNSFFRDNDTKILFQTWAVIYKALLAEKKMDRGFFIENAILIQTKEWNNNLKSFFRERIQEFNFTAEELIVHQEKIFALLHCYHPPITNCGIDLVKKIYDHPKFKPKSFLEWLEHIMMRSDCKAAIKSVLPVLEKLAKTNPKLNATIAVMVADVYITGNYDIQQRATKIITKIANVKDKVLKEKLASYETLMQGDVKPQLAAFLEKEVPTSGDTVHEEYKYVIPQKKLVLLEKVELPKDWNDILLLFKNFIPSYNKPLHSEILMHVYIAQRALFPANYAAQLQPYVEKLEEKDHRSTFRDNPHHHNFMKAFLQQKMINMDDKFNGDNPYRSYPKHQSGFVMPYLLEKVQQKIDANSILPLLSFPSHKPHWVAPEVLLKRIIAYQTAHEEIDPMDLAIAIARMPRENVAEALPLLDKIEGELKQLLSFCLGADEKLILDSNTAAELSNLMATVERTTGKTADIALWAVAARTFYPNNTFPEFENTYLKEFENTYLKDIPFMVAPLKPELYYYCKRFSAPRYDSSKLPNYLLYSLRSFLLQQGNTAFYNSLIPQNSDVVAVALLSDGSSSGMLHLINQPEFQFSETSLITFAHHFYFLEIEEAEILIKLIEKQAIDIELFAQKLAFVLPGKHLGISQLIDNLIAIKDVSPLHNNALVKLMNSFFAHLDLKEELPKNFKKIVVNYLNVLTTTNQKPSDEALVFFEQWKDNTSHKSLINKILKLN